MNNFGVGALTLMAALVASALSFQTASAHQGTIDNIEINAVERQTGDDLTSALQSHQIRTKVLTLDPGGAVELRGHRELPTFLHVVKGTLTSRPKGQPEVVLRAGDSLAEGKDSTCWIQNTGTEPAEFIWMPFAKTPR
jgi:quercetin dioxygenase-like cupin family protein